MVKYQKFDELPAWQESARLYQRVLDLLEEANLPLSTSFRGQLERAALSISSRIAESRDRMSGREALNHLVSARAAATEVQSMVAVISQRPKVARLSESLQQIRTLAESCARQLSAWAGTIENGPRQSKPTPAETPNATEGRPAAPLRT
jgi:four helix bundle protein